ncbi:MAG: tyrosine-type recombinase/integrase [Clostridia bacterium]|nr:tyrosine-type recombinase/integrase [Clostridia bacterium]
MADGEAFDALMNTPFRGIRGRRDRVMLLLLRETALSVSELVSLRRGDLNPVTHRLTVGGKTVVLSASLSRALSEYAAVTALVSEDGAMPLFVNEAGQAISRQGFWKNVKARARLAGLPEEYTLQSFRREKNKKG